MDVLVVVAVLALLGINLPVAIVPLREVARKQACASHLKQIGVALHAYAEIHGRLPAAAVWSPEGLDLEHFFKDGRPITVTQQNWVQAILPYLGETALASRFRSDVPVTHPDNASARKRPLVVFQCPSDDFQRTDNPYVLTLADGSESQFTRGNYAINGGSQFWGRAPGYLSNPRPSASHFEFDPETREFQFWGCGVAGINRSFALDEFTNGLSTLVAVDEVRAGVHAIDPRGVWALGQIGSSITWGHGVMGDAGKPNSPIKDADDVADCPRLHQLVGADYLQAVNMPCCDHCDQNQQAGARSRHAGGVHVLMLDGSVHFLSDRIDLGLWQILHSRETPAEAAEEDFSGYRSGKSPVLQEQTPPTPRQAETALRPGETLTNSLGQQFVLIPAGEFIMGLPNENNASPVLEEAPAHRVMISRPYLLGVHEVTQSEFAAVMGRNPSWHAPSGGGADRMAGADTSQFPVEQVTWHDAVEFCRRLSARPAEQQAGRSYRLPTEAEWEYACRAGKLTPYRLNSEWDENDDSGIIASKSVEKKGLVPRPVGSYRPNEFGLYDMCGNVFEWTADWFAADYYSRSPSVDPQGPAGGSVKVIRGWYWLFTGPACKDNIATAPSGSSRFVGFRIVCVAGKNSLVAEKKSKNGPRF